MQNYNNTHVVQITCDICNSSFVWSDKIAVGCARKRKIARFRRTSIFFVAMSVCLCHVMVILIYAAENRWHQLNNMSQRKGRSFGDVNPLATENGWVPTTRSGGAYQQGSRSNDQQLLAEREAELRAIRWTMEKNEAAILQAMEDQRRASEAAVAAERESWECRLSDAERRIDDVRQTLTERIHDLERDNAALEHENAALLLSSVERAPQHNRAQSSRTVQRDEHLVTARNQHSDDERLDDSNKELLVTGVDGRLHAARNFSSSSSTSTTSTRSSADQRRPPLTHVNCDSTGIDASASRLPAIPEGPVTRCHHCEMLSNEIERVKHEFDAERQQWLAEKRRVIEYQKLLQSKYIQLERRYAALERWTPADKLNCVESVDGVTSGSHPLRGAWNSGQTQTSLLFPRLIPFGQSIET